MSFAPEFSQGNFVPENYIIPDEPEQMKEFLKTSLEKMARFVNRKDMGQYETVEVQVNQTFPGATAQDKRQVSRKVFAFGAIGVGGNLIIPHGINGTIDFTRIYGTCITAIDTRPLPFNSVAAANQGVQLLTTAVNIVIINGGAAPAIISGRVILEFMKN